MCEFRLHELIVGLRLAFHIHSKRRSKDQNPIYSEVFCFDGQSFENIKFILFSCSK